MTAHLALAHVAFQFGLRDEGGHGVHHHQVHGAGAHQHVGDVQGLLTVVGLGDEQLVGVDAQAPGVVHVQGVFGVHEGTGAAHFLAFGDDVQGKGGLARRFGAEDLRDTAARDTAHAQGQVETDGTRGDDGDIDMGFVGKLHDRAFAVLAFDGGKCGAQGFGAGFFRRKGRFFGHRDAPCRKFKQRSIAKRARQGKEGGRPPGTGPCGLRGCRLRHGAGPCACRASQDTPWAGGRLCGRAQKLRYSGINLNNCQGEKGRLCGGRSGARCSCSLYRIPLQVPMPCRRAGADGRAFGPRRQTAGPFAGKGVPRQGMRHACGSSRASPSLHGARRGGRAKKTYPKAVKIRAGLLPPAPAFA